MRVLELNQKLFIFIGIFPSTYTKKRSKIRGAILFLLNFLGMIASAYYITQLIDIDLELTAHAIFQVSAYVTTSFLFIFGYIYWPEFEKVFPMLQRIHDNCKSS